MIRPSVRLSEACAVGDVALVGDEVVLRLRDGNLRLDDVELGDGASLEARLRPLQEIAARAAVRRAGSRRWISATSSESYVADAWSAIVCCWSR